MEWIKTKIFNLFFGGYIGGAARHAVSFLSGLLAAFFAVRTTIPAEQAKTIVDLFTQLLSAIADPNVLYAIALGLYAVGASWLRSIKLPSTPSVVSGSAR